MNPCSQEKAVVLWVSFLLISFLYFLILGNIPFGVSHLGDLKGKNEHTWVINPTLKRFKLLRMKLDERRSTHRRTERKKGRGTEFYFPCLPCDRAGPSTGSQRGGLPRRTRREQTWGAPGLALRRHVSAQGSCTSATVMRRKCSADPGRMADTWQGLNRTQIWAPDQRPGFGSSRTQNRRKRWLFSGADFCGGLSWDAPVTMDD